MESMNSGETIEKEMTLVSNSSETGWSGKRICFVSSAALMAASQIPLQHARMLRMKTGCRPSQKWYDHRKGLLRKKYSAGLV